MRKLKEGDILKLNKTTLEILGVCGKAVLANGSMCDGVILTQELIEKSGWKLEEPKWKPEYQEEYYFPAFYDKGFYSGSEWEDSPIDTLLLERGLIFKTSEEAIAKCKEMLGLDKQN